MIKQREHSTDYALRYVIQHDGDTETLARHIEDVDGVEILSLGNSLELIKDLGDAGVSPSNTGCWTLAAPTALATQGWRQNPMWIFARRIPIGRFPYNDVSVVHNGQITNYWLMRREMEHKGHRFMSSCDSELLAVYTAHNMSMG